MLEGIEILDKTEILYTSKAAALLCAFSMVAIIVAAITSVATVVAKQIKVAIISAIVFVLFTITIIVSSSFINKPTGTYQYQVTIDKNVSMVEFHEKYEIVDIKGKIYTIKEKE